MFCVVFSVLKTAQIQTHDLRQMLLCKRPNSVCGRRSRNDDLGLDYLRRGEKVANRLQYGHVVHALLAVFRISKKVTSLKDDLVTLKEI